MNLGGPIGRDVLSGERRAKYFKIFWYDAAVTLMVVLGFFTVIFATPQFSGYAYIGLMAYLVASAIYRWRRGETFWQMRRAEIAEGKAESAAMLEEMKQLKSKGGK